MAAEAPLHLDAAVVVSTMPPAAGAERLPCAMCPPDHLEGAALYFVVTVGAESATIALPLCDGHRRTVLHMLADPEWATRELDRMVALEEERNARGARR